MRRETLLLDKPISKFDIEVLAVGLAECPLKTKVHAEWIGEF
jgi:hypothetical protein